jgi:hypothetical protein
LEVISLKILIRNCCAFIFTVLVIVLFIPVVSAADNASILKTIGHESTNTVSPGSQRSVTLYVPYNYAKDTVDLQNGLEITSDENAYKNVVAVPQDIAEVDGIAVTLTVTYNEIEDADSDEKSQTEYQVYVKRTAAKDPEFSGKISKTSKYPGTVTFSKNDFTAKYSQNDGNDLASISIAGSNLTAGTLMLAGSNYSFGDFISIDSINNLTFAAKNNGSVSYIVSAYSGNSSDTLVGTAVLTITVSAYSVPTIEKEITDTLSAGDTLSFSLSTFTNCCDLNDGTLESIEITPKNTAYGTWYTNGSKFTAATAFSPSGISNLSFTGSKEGDATFSWRVSNQAGYSAYGNGTITVSLPQISLNSYSASSEINKGDTLTLSPSNFNYTPSTVNLVFVKIITVPNSTDGYLYLSTNLAKDGTAGYNAINANKALSANSVIPYSYLKYLKVATKSSSANTSASFTWTATTGITVKTAVWADSATYTIRFVNAGKVEYSTASGIPVMLDDKDFSKEFNDETDEELSYVIFTLPAKTSGTLYYNYDTSKKTGTAVAAKTKYYTSGSPRISDVVFVPVYGYKSDTKITYEAYADESTHATGTLEINIFENAGGTVGYLADKNCAVRFDAGDFADAFKDATGKALKFVKFSLPSSSYGTLYYNYISSSDYDSTVSSSNKYYVYSSPYLSYVAFVPDEDYKGTVTITYTAYSSNGTSYRGKVIIHVLDSAGGIVAYSISKNTPLTLSGDDFADAFISATGSVLSHITFTLPDKTAGELIYQYSSEKGKGTKVAAKTSYYHDSSPDISDITFVPAKDYTGSIAASYTAYTPNGKGYSGKLKITVGETEIQAISYDTEEDTPVTFRSIDFASRFLSSTGNTLSYVTFSLPADSYGELYYSYISDSNHGLAVTENTNYYMNATPYLSNIVFVPNAGYHGSFTINYEGFDASGTGCEGRIKMTVGDTEVGTVNYVTDLNTEVTFDASDFNTPFKSDNGENFSYIKFSLPSSSMGRLYYNYTSSANSTKVNAATKYYRNSSPNVSKVSFVPNDDYAGTVSIDYIAYDSNGEDYPGSILITVKDDTKPDTGTDQPDINKHFSDVGENYFWASEAIGRLYNAGVVTGTGDDNFSPHKSITRGDFILMVCRAFKFNAATSSNFADVRSGSYYYPAIATAKSLGIVQGSKNSFYPDTPISRQDAMVILSRALSAVGNGLAAGNRNDLSAFSDKDNVSDYAVGAVSALVKAGIVTGTNGALYPDSNITRAEMSVILDRLLTKYNFIN